MVPTASREVGQLGTRTGSRWRLREMKKGEDSADSASSIACTEAHHIYATFRQSRLKPLSWHAQPITGKKERKSIYIAPVILRIVSERSDMLDYTVLPANYTMPAFPS